MKEAKIYNGTAHQINIYNLEQCDQSNQRKLIVKEGESPVFVIEPGVNLNCVKGNQSAPKHLEVPFAVKGAVTFESVDELPANYDIYVVSNLYRSAYRELIGDSTTLATVDGVVYSDPENPRPCGCLGLAIG